MVPNPNNSGWIFKPLTKFIDIPRCEFFASKGNVQHPFLTTV